MKHTILFAFGLIAILMQADEQPAVHKDFLLSLPSQQYTYTQLHKEQTNYSVSKILLIPTIITCMLYLARKTVINDIQEHPYLAIAIGIASVQYLADTVAHLHYERTKNYIIKQVETILDVLVIACGVKNELQAHSYIYPENVFDELTKQSKYSLQDLQKIIDHNKKLFEHQEELYFNASTGQAINQYQQAITKFEVFQACKKNIKLQVLIEKFYQDPTMYYHDVLQYLAYTLQQALKNLKKCNVLY